MVDPSLIEAHLRQLTLPELQAALAASLPPGASFAERTSAVESALRGPAGKLLRDEMGRRMVQLLPPEILVPHVYARWRPLVRDAIRLIIARMPAERLAPKLVEQIALPHDTPPEARLLRLIGKMPGFQKLGQILARNRYLHPALRAALSELENGIADASAEEIGAIIRALLKSRLQRGAVEVSPQIFSEASVSAVVRFTWRNPASQRREAGVFKVLKPHIPACFAADMELLQQLAEFFAAKRGEYGFAARALPDTFQEVRLLLEREVDFLREQATLREAGRLYASVSGIRIPRLIPPLCTSTITALTEERGAKVTDAVAHLPAHRRARVGEQLIEALIATPMFSPEAEAMFHADPHAGNLLYDEPSGELVLLDWALTERLSLDQRRHLAMLFLMIGLRDPAGIGDQIQALSHGVSRAGAPARKGEARRQAPQARVIRECVAGFLEQLPITGLPGMLDAMRLIDRLALAGIPFPAPLIMLRKALFTLDGILHEIAGAEVGKEAILVRHLMQRWTENYTSFGSPLFPTDWITVQCSALFYGSRVWTQWAETILSGSCLQATFAGYVDAGQAGLTR